MKTQKRCKATIGAVAASLALAAVSTQAQVLNFGATASIAPGGTLANQELVGVAPGGNVGANNGTISTWVISDSSLDASGLIFIYQAVNQGPDAIDNVELTGFTSSEVLSVGEYSSLSGPLAFGATPSADGGNFTLDGTLADIAGNVTFQSRPPLGNTSSTDISDYLAIFTDVSAFGLSYGEIQDSFSAQGNIFAPVPEANTVVAGALMLLPLGIGAVRAFRKQRTA